VNSFPFVPVTVIRILPTTIITESTIRRNVTAKKIDVPVKSMKPENAPAQTETVHTHVKGTNTHPEALRVDATSVQPSLPDSNDVPGGACSASEVIASGTQRSSSRGVLTVHFGHTIVLGIASSTVSLINAPHAGHVADIWEKATSYGWHL
jgi:hypothetical protein